MPTFSMTGFNSCNIWKLCVSCCTVIFILEKSCINFSNMYYILFLVCLACIGAGYGIYELVWALRLRKIRQKYHNMSEEELRKERKELSRELRDFFGLRTSKGGCMPDRMLLLKNGCLLEEFELRNLSE